MHGQQPRLLILDDSSLDLRQWGRMLGECGYEVVTREAGDDFKTREELSQIIADLKPDCLLTDFDMQGLSAFLVLAAMKKAALNIPIILHATDIPGIERYTGKSRQELVDEGFFTAVFDKGNVKAIDSAFKHHLQSAQRSS